MSKIYFIRGQKVMLDSDLAELYQVETKGLKRAVNRNLDIFPNYFMFELTENEFTSLRSQIGTPGLQSPAPIIPHYVKACTCLKGLL